MTELQPSAWISPPGDTICDLLEERGWSKAELAERLGCTPKHLSQVLGGTASIHSEMAAALSRVLGSTAEFWLEREARYRAALDRKTALDSLAADAGWLKDLPLAWMVKERLVRKFPHRGEQAEEVLRFFGVASVPAWRSVYSGSGPAFRTSASFGSRPGAVATWLRSAEIAAEKVSCRNWDAREFKALLPRLRSLTLRPDPAVFGPQLIEACAASGVAVVIVPTPPGCPASGATRWLTPEKALLVLSLRHKSNDHLWFTFFHESAHLLLHSKKMAFLEGMQGLDPALENEANAFASDLLIPPQYASELTTLRTVTAVRAFAARIGIHPGIVVGRLQKEGLLRWSAMNDLKQRYDWAERKDERVPSQP